MTIEVRTSVYPQFLQHHNHEDMLFKAIIASFVAGVCTGGHLGHSGFGHGYYGDSLVAAEAGGSLITAEPVYPPQPYNFGYDSVDEFGTQTYRKEQSDARNIKTGSYGYKDAYGVYRRVEYVADENGFRAKVHTNEAGTAPGATGDAVYDAKPQPAGSHIHAAASGHHAQHALAPAVPAFGGITGPLPWAG
ncbi:uncharacterized protein LOC144168108 [Haemaphysalis longicornis]